MKAKYFVLGFIERTPAKSAMMLALFACIGMVWVSAANASTAANATIRNTVTVQYADAAGTAQTPLIQTVDLTVNLVASTPVLSAPVDISIDASGTATYNYTITATANGLDTYNLSQESLTESAGIAGSTALINGGTLSIPVGATTVATAGAVNAGSNTVIEVPSDLASDGQVNGIAAGDTVVIGGFEFTVAAIADNGGVGTSTITVAFTGDTPALTYGALIVEREAFTVVVTPGTVSDATAAQTIDLQIGAQDSAAAAAMYTDDTQTTVTAVLLTITKYVRNVDTGVVGGGLSVTVGGATYYTTGVNGAPGDTMEYLIAIANGAGSSANDLVIVDQIPQFTTYAGSMQLDPGTGTFGALNEDAAGTDAGEYDAAAPATVYIYAGSGGDDGGAGFGDGNGGTLAASTTTYGRFRVTIDN